MAMADPYLLYQTSQDQSSSEERSNPVLNDQASLSRIFKKFPFFASHFHEIPGEWANLYPPKDLDGKLDAESPHLLPSHVDSWISKMQQVAGNGSSSPKTFRAVIPPSLPRRLDENALLQLKSLLTLPSVFLPNDFNGALQIHLVNYRKYQFYYNSLVIINTKFMQIGLAALVIQYHEKLATSVHLDPIELWKNERDSSIWGMKYIQPQGLEERQVHWYRQRKSGIQGMKWLD